VFFTYPARDYHGRRRSNSVGLPQAHILELPDARRSRTWVRYGDCRTAMYSWHLQTTVFKMPARTDFY
jgi:hypothetical protein